MICKRVRLRLLSFERALFSELQVVTMLTEVCLTRVLSNLLELDSVDDIFSNR